MLGDETFYCIAAKCASADAWEHRIVWLPASFSEPRFDHYHGLPAKRCATVLSALSHTANMRTVTQNHVLASQAGQLGDPEACLDGYRQ